MAKVHFPTDIKVSGWSLKSKEASDASCSHGFQVLPTNGTETFFIEIADINSTYRVSQNSPVAGYFNFSASVSICDNHESPVISCNRIKRTEADRFVDSHILTPWKLVRLFDPDAPLCLPSYYSSNEEVPEIDKFSHLKPGWDGYKAEPPSEWAINTSKKFIKLIDRKQDFPIRIKPSVIGGVGITLRNPTAKRKVYIEFINDNTCHVLYSDGKTEPTVTTKATDTFSLSSLISNIWTYLNVSASRRNDEKRATERQFLLWRRNSLPASTT